MPFAGNLCTTVMTKLLWIIPKWTFWLLSRTFFLTDRRMEGTWLTVFAADGNIHEETVKTVQFARWVRGHIDYQEKSRSYVFSGTMRGDVLVAGYETAGQSSIRDRGSFTLAGNPVGELRVLDGCYAWTDDRTQRPRADEYIWVRQGDTKIPDRVTSRESLIEGTGVFATRCFAEGEILGYFVGSPVEEGTKHSLTLDGRQIEPNGILRHLNHCCKPNAKFRGRWLVATLDITQNDEITIDYTVTESMISSGFECKCQTQNCRGRVGTGSS